MDSLRYKAMIMDIIYLNDNMIKVTDVEEEEMVEEDTGDGFRWTITIIIIARTIIGVNAI